MPEAQMPLNPFQPTLGDLEPRAWLEAIVDSSDDAIVSKTLDGIVTTWNKGAERIFGYTRAEMIGQPILKIIPPDRQEEEPMILRRIGRGERVDHFETVRRRKDGTLMDISVTISPVLDSSGRIIGVSKIARDITVQKRLIEELNAAKESAESANRAKDYFLSVLSHELRTPLTPVLAALTMIERDASLTTSLREHLTMIRRNVETQARLVDDLLDVTRIARGKISLQLESVDAHAAIRNIVAMFQQFMDEKSQSLTLALRAKLFHIRADSGRFQQILLNLLSNAVKFTPSEGSITIATSNDERALYIEVIDTGAGIEPQVLPRLFTAFEQGEQGTHRRFGGLGLGLSIVKSLVEMHGGTVSADSEGYQRGARFSLAIPLSLPKESGKDIPAPLPSANARQPLRLLLVEDHPDSRRMLGMLLETIGCSVISVGSVKEAQGQLDRNPFDLLVSDFSLPDGTGAEVMRYARERQQIQGVAMTGFGQEEDIRRSHAAGFAVHLTKPINLDTLEQAIQSLNPRVGK